MQAIMMFATYAGYALACYLPIAYILRLVMNWKASKAYNSDDLILAAITPSP